MRKGHVGDGSELRAQVSRSSVSGCVSPPCICPNGKLEFSDSSTGCLGLARALSNLMSDSCLHFGSCGAGRCSRPSCIKVFLLEKKQTPNSIQRSGRRLTQICFAVSPPQRGRHSTCKRISGKRTAQLPWYQTL